MADIMIVENLLEHEKVKEKSFLQTISDFFKNEKVKSGMISLFLVFSLIMIYMLGQTSMQWTVDHVQKTCQGSWILTNYGLTGITLTQNNSLYQQAQSNSPLIIGGG